jgi:phosphate uptake regulator
MNDRLTVPNRAAWLGSMTRSTRARAHARRPANGERGTRILFASHYLERIDDRVTNIAEDIVFLASGEEHELNP